MVSPKKPQKPQPCPECKTVMERVTLPVTKDQTEPEVRWTCPNPQCLHTLPG